MPNFLVDAPGRDFPEDAWVGRVLRIGGLRMRVDQRDQCCVMVTIDPVTLRRDPAILRHSPGARQPARGLRLDRAAGPGGGGRPGRTRALSPLAVILTA